MNRRVCKELPTQDVLNTLFEYSNGDLYWKYVPIELQIEMGVAKTVGGAKRRNLKLVGKVAGTVCGNYKVVEIFKEKFMCHRIMLKMVYNCEGEVVDHIDGDTLNNCVENLRWVSSQGNARNTKLYKHNTSGTMGVAYLSRTKRWYAYIYLNTKKMHLGYFKTRCEAVKARKFAEKEFGFHKNHGR